MKNVIKFATKKDGYIIRCKDCFYWREEDFCVNPQWNNNSTNDKFLLYPCTDYDDFCSYAECGIDVQSDEHETVINTDE